MGNLLATKGGTAMDSTPPPKSGGKKSKNSRRRNYEKILNLLVVEPSWEQMESMLTENPVLATAVDTNTGQNCLHMAILCKAPLSLLKIILVHYPGTISERDEVGFTPLHYAIKSVHNKNNKSNNDDNQEDRDKKLGKKKHPNVDRPTNTSAATKGLDIDTVMFLVQAYQATQQWEDSSGNRTQVEDDNNVDDTFLDTKPLALFRIGDSEGRIPLHWALMQNFPEPELTTILQADPASALARTVLGKYAIHFACEFGAPKGIIEELIKLSPIALKEPNNLRLPLHFAVENKASIEVVQLLHEANPLAVEFRGVEGMLPVHLSVQHRASLAVMELLIAAYPAGLLHRDRKGRMPLHYALERTAPESLVMCILQHRPDTATHRGLGSPGNFPLSTALIKHYSHRVIKTLVDACVEAVSEPNIMGMIPLHAALKYNAAPETVRLLLESYPAAASKVDDHGRLALHYIASRNMDIDLVKGLLQAYPHGASCQDKNLQLPLHQAIIRHVSIDILTLLVEYHPQGVMTADRYDFTAINYAIENNGTLEVFQLLLQATSGKQQEREPDKINDNSSCNNDNMDKNGLESANNNESRHRGSDQNCAQHCIRRDGLNKTVLHHAIEFKREFEIISEILNAYPEAIQQQEGQLGRLPLHWAIERLCSLPILSLLDKAYTPDGAYIQDTRGWRSIHYCVHYPTPTPIVQQILKANPAVATVKDDSLHLQFYAEQSALLQESQLEQELMHQFGAFPPVPADKDAYLLLHYAIAFNAKPETVAEILLYTMPYNYQNGKFYAYHYDTWPYILAYCGDRYHKSVDIVLTHYENNQNLINVLGQFPNQHNQKCLDIATAKSLHQILRRMYYFSLYEMHNQICVHKSKYNLLQAAVYHTSDHHTPVVMKFCSQRSRFMREILVRRSVGKSLSPDYTMRLMNSHNSQEDRNYLREIELKSFSEYPFLMVLQAAERDLLSIAKHEHVAGILNDLSSLQAVQQYTIQLLTAVQHLHQLGIVHGDLKPTNIVRDMNTLKIMNFCSAARFVDHELVSGELAHLAYTCPELAQIQRFIDLHGEEHDYQPQADGSTAIESYSSSSSSNNNNNNGLPVNTKLTARRSEAPDDSHAHIHSNDLVPVPSSHQYHFNRVRAEPSQDMWSVGAILYLLHTGESLFLTTLDEDIDSDQLDILIDWPKFAKDKRMEKIASPQARSLISQLLSLDPKLRPSAEFCLRHLYCTQEVMMSIDMIQPPSRPVTRPTTSSSTSATAAAMAMLEPQSLQQQRAQEEKKYTEAVAKQHALALNTVRFLGAQALYDVYISSKQSPPPLSVRHSSGSPPTTNRSSGGVSTKSSEELVAHRLCELFVNDYSVTVAPHMHSIFAPASTNAVTAVNNINAVPVSAADAPDNDQKQQQQQQQQQHPGQEPHVIDSPFPSSTAPSDVQLTQCSGAVLVLTRSTWHGLETLIDNHLVLPNNTTTAPAVPSQTQTGTSHIAPNNDDSKVREVPNNDISEVQEEGAAQDTNVIALLDFLFELRLIYELRGMGLLERGVYVLAVGDARESGGGVSSSLNPVSDHPSTPLDDGVSQQQGQEDPQQQQSHGVVFDAYFAEHYGDMVGRFGGAHPHQQLPDLCVEVVEQRVGQYLNTHGYSCTSLLGSVTLNEIFRFLVRLPTMYVVGDAEPAVRYAAMQVSDSLLSIPMGSTFLAPTASYTADGRTSASTRGSSSSPLHSRPNTGAFSMLHSSHVGSMRALSPQASSPGRSSRRTNTAGSRGSTPSNKNNNNTSNNKDNSRNGMNSREGVSSRDSRSSQSHSRSRSRREFHSRGVTPGNDGSGAGFGSSSGGGDAWHIGAENEGFHALTTKARLISSSRGSCRGNSRGGGGSGGGGAGSSFKKMTTGSGRFLSAKSKTANGKDQDGQDCEEEDDDIGFGNLEMEPIPASPGGVTFDFAPSRLNKSPLTGLPTQNVTSGSKLSVSSGKQQPGGWNEHQGAFQASSHRQQSPHPRHGRPMLSSRGSSRGSRRSTPTAAAAAAGGGGGGTTAAPFSSVSTSNVVQHNQQQNSPPPRKLPSFGIGGAFNSGNTLNFGEVVAPENRQRMSSRGSGESAEGYSFSPGRRSVRPPSSSSMPFGQQQTPPQRSAYFLKYGHEDDYGDGNDDNEEEEEVVPYYQEDIQMPYFTEIVGEDRIRTGAALNFMSTKLEASENQIANLEDELALLREQMRSRDSEINTLKSVLSSSAIRVATVDASVVSAPTTTQQSSLVHSLEIQDQTSQAVQRLGVVAHRTQIVQAKKQELKIDQLRYRKNQEDNEMQIKALLEHHV